MLYPFSRFCRNCDERYFEESPGFSACPKCFETLRAEYLRDGTLGGFRLTTWSDVVALRNIHLVTNKKGRRARVHVVHERYVIGNSEPHIVADCGSQLNDINAIRPVVDASSISDFDTHSQDQTRWCSRCEKRSRRLTGNIRAHRFMTKEMGGFPVVFSLEAPKGPNAQRE